MTARSLTIAAVALALAACSPRPDTAADSAAISPMADSNAAPAGGPTSTPSIGTSGAAASDSGAIRTDSLKADSAKRP